MKNRKYIIALVIALIIFYLVHNIFLLRVYEFNKGQEYVFADRKTSDILEDCEKLYDDLENNGQMINIVKLIQLSSYLLYEDSIDSVSYYDLMMTVMASENRKSLHCKEDYCIEIDEYLNRKRKAGIRHIKYEASVPVFYDDENQKCGYVVAKIYWDSSVYYLKYSFIYEDGFWHLRGVKAVDTVKEKG